MNPPHFECATDSWVLPQTEIKDLPHNPGTLILRCDASTAMGTGHVMRCFALAQAWQDAGGRPVFAIAEAAPAIRERLLADNMEVGPLEVSAGGEDDARKVEELALRHAAEWVMVDGYQFGADYQRQLKAAGLKVLFVDDNGHAGHYCADLVLNQNVHADESLYVSREPYTQLLLGLRYALLRREFTRWRDWKREIAAAGRKILVTMGGSDPGNVTWSIIDALHQMKIPFEAKVIVGGANPHYVALECGVGGSSAKIELVRNPLHMPELMAWADVAVAAAGSTCWELCLLGLPAILMDVAPNQRRIAQELDAGGYAIHIGSAGEISAERMAAQIEWLLGSREMRVAVSSKARELVDGQGCGRVLSAILTKKIRLREAIESDSQLLFEWANDAEARASSFSSAPIPWEQHEAWFAEKLHKLGALMFIAVNGEETPIGLLRCDILDKSAVLSVNVDRQFRGRGYGIAILSLGLEELFRATRVEKIMAYVKPENLASVRLFTKSGFTQGERNVIDGHAAIVFVLEKSPLHRRELAV
jgi:UDP-2,4-diacetamido-2,4,6-trideoxy-beta-L-altropyranose hydrolase